MAGGPSLRDNLSERPAERPAASAVFGGGVGAPRRPTSRSRSTPADFDAFEKLLGDIQTAYGKEDLGALRAHLTPEMLSYFSEELARNASRGVVNQISDVKLLQGDLSEAWREVNDEYATVAMRYSLNDKIVDRATGRVVEERAVARPPSSGPSAAPAAASGCSRRSSRPTDRVELRSNANGRAESPAILFVSSVTALPSMNSKCSASSQARIVVVRTLPFELTLSTYLATASSFGASMICTKS